MDKNYFSNIELNQKYILNPEYTIVSDVNRVLLISQNIFVNSFSAFIHPMYAVLLSLFNGNNILETILIEIEQTFNINSNEAFNLVYKFIENKKHINIRYDNVSFTLPINVIVNNTNGIIRTDIDTDKFILKPPYDFTSKRLHMPVRVLFILNMNCVTDCIYCYADRNHKYVPLPLEKVLNIIDEAKLSGIIDLHISGGDVFSNKDWPIFLKKIFELGYKPYISTKKALTEEDINKLLEIGVEEIQVSLDTLDSHLAQKNLKVSLDYTAKIKESIRLLDNKGISLTIKSTVTRYTCSLENISELLAFMEGLSNVKKYTFTPLSYSQYKTVELFNELKPDLEQVMDVIDLLEDKRGTVPFFIHIDNSNVTDGSEWRTDIILNSNTICSANFDSIVILPDGKVTICEELYWDENFILGDLTEKSLKEIWTSDKAVSLWYMKKDMLPEDSVCITCEDFERCRHGGKVCWKKNIAYYGRDNWLYPEMTCSKAPKPHYPVFYDNSFIDSEI